MNDSAHWDHRASFDTAEAVGADAQPSVTTDGARVFGPPAVVWRLLHRLRDVGIARRLDHDHYTAADSASDKEVQRLAGPLGRLHVEDARWDVIGAAHGGKRRRI